MRSKVLPISKEDKKLAKKHLKETIKLNKKKIKDHIKAVKKQGSDRFYHQAHIKKHQQEVKQDLKLIKKL